MKTKLTISIRILSLALCLFILSDSHAQTKLQKAKDLKNKYEYVKAIEAYNDYYTTASPSVGDARDVAECYLMTNDTKSAETWLAKVVAMGGTPADQFMYASVLKSNGKYAEAIAQYQDYAAKNPAEKTKADLQVEACKNATQWMNETPTIEVKNVAVLNSSNSDFGLVSLEKGYVFTSDRKLDDKTYGSKEVSGWTGNPYYKLYSLPSDNQGNPSSTIQAISSLNNDYHNGPGIYYPAKKIIYFTRTKTVKIPREKVNSDPTSWYERSASSGEYINRLEIYSATYENSTWSPVAAFKYNNADAYSVGHPALSPDGKTLYFVSDMPGAIGGTDIYYCEQTADGQWSQPQNAGSVINTTGKEMFPYVDGEGTLYYSSDGLPGMGGLDLFSSTGSKGKWTVPANLKYPINSPKDDFSIYYTETAKKGYFSSNRDGGKGSDDIYSFGAAEELPKKLILVVTTKEKLDDKSLVVLGGVSLKLDNTLDNTSSTLKTDDKGKSFSSADCNTSYNMAASKDGYFNQSKSFTTECRTKNDTMYIELVFEKIVIGKTYVIENIYYDFDKYNIRPDAAVELDKVVNLLIKNPDVSIELGSHTDCRGTNAYNDVLSQNRAESAVKYIVDHGVSKARITAKGYGETKLVNKCADDVYCSEADHQLNRRTEFKVTGVFRKQ